MATRKTGTRRGRQKKTNLPPQSVDTEQSVAMERFRGIDEIESHKIIYEPLLQRMGFQHVTYCHGQFERGKDFVCVDRNRLGQMDLTVVQVKNSRIRGDSSSDDSAIGIINQMERCISTRILNPATHREELPRRVILFSSYPFPDHAVAGMGDRLEQLRRVCEIVEGTAILDLIKEHLPEIYADLVHPGQGIAAAVLRQLRVTSELTAIGVNRDRELRTFYINIGVSPPRGPLDEIANGKLKASGSN